MSVPVIDLFAGPGGLGEGFSQVGWKEGKRFFRIGLSVEKDANAHRTLKLRSFFRQFPYGQAPEEYYEYLREGREPEELYEIEKYKEESGTANREAWLAELGGGEKFDALLDEKIRKVLSGERNWVLIGGPPCQAYSIAGRARNKAVKDYSPEKDGRHFLYQEYLRIIARHRPAVFVMENVKGILSSKVNGDKIFEQIEQDLKNPLGLHDCHYRIFSLVKTPEAFDLDGAPVLKKEDFIIEAENYGIPQARHRVILLGVREDLCHKESIPNVLSYQSELVAIKKVLNLPKLRSGISRGKYDRYDWRKAIEGFEVEKFKDEIINLGGKKLFNILKCRLSQIPLPQKDVGGEFVDTFPRDLPRGFAEWYEDRRLRGVLNHSSRTHMVSDLHRYFYAACFAEANGWSPRIHEFPEGLKPKHKNRDSGHFNDRFRVQLKDDPACTITSHISKDGHYYIHFDPAQCRSLTVREAARIQTFPDNYFFCGNRTQQYTQVGNAVPPLLANKIAEVVRSFLIKSGAVQNSSSGKTLDEEVALSVA